MRLALDIGGTFIKCACVSDDGVISRSGKFPTDPNLANESFASHIISGVKSFMADGDEKFDLVGAGMAGFADGRNGIVYESPNLPGVKNLHLAGVLKDGLGIPAYIENDATAAAWGEFLFGKYSDIKNMMVVTLGTGIGGGLVLDGNLYRGSGGMAGEIGQMIYEPGGDPCGGGGLGCLENFNGKAGLMEEYRILAGLDTSLEPGDITERAVNGDTAAIEAYKKYGYRLGVIFASSANLLDLDCIILTGGIIGAWDFFSGALRDSSREHIITPLKDKLRIELTSLSGNAGILGAAFLDRAF